MHLHRMYSDHNPLFISLFRADPRRGPRPFRFEVAWVSHLGYGEVVKGAWCKKDRLVDCLDEVRAASIEFNKDTFGNIFHRKRSIINRLNGIQKALESIDSVRLSLVEAELRKELDHILCYGELRQINLLTATVKFYCYFIKGSFPIEYSQPNARVAMPQSCT